MFSLPSFALSRPRAPFCCVVFASGALWSVVGLPSARFGPYFFLPKKGTPERNTEKHTLTHKSRSVLNFFLTVVGSVVFGVVFGLSFWVLFFGLICESLVLVFFFVLVFGVCLLRLSLMFLIGVSHLGFSLAFVFCVFV